MSRTVIFSILILAAGISPALAQQPPQGHPQQTQPQLAHAPQPPQKHGSGDAHDVVARHFFPPEMIMAHQRDIGLGEDQREAIKAAVDEAHSAVHDLKWDLQPEVQALAEMVAADSIDEAAVLAQAERVMDMEQRIKLLHMALVIRIKNLLTSEQRQTLRRSRGGKRPPGH